MNWIRLGRFTSSSGSELLGSDVAKTTASRGQGGSLAGASSTRAERAARARSGVAATTRTPRSASMSTVGRIPAGVGREDGGRHSQNVALLGSLELAELGELGTRAGRLARLRLDHGAGRLQLTIGRFHQPVERLREAARVLELGHDRKARWVEPERRVATWTLARGNHSHAGTDLRQHLVLQAQAGAIAEAFGQRSAPLHCFGIVVLHELLVDLGLLAQIKRKEHVIGLAGQRNHPGSGLDRGHIEIGEKSAPGTWSVDRERED